MNGYSERIPVDRVLRRLDEYLDRKDFSSAERHLSNWLREAQALGDSRGMLCVLNEQIGFYRKQNDRQKGLCAVQKALELANAPEFSSTLTLMTTLINAATACKAFEDPGKAIALYTDAKSLSEALSGVTGDVKAGLYNNMALAYADLKEFDEAERLYLGAIGLLEKEKGYEPEIAITWLNLADLFNLKLGLIDGDAKITDCLNRAEALLIDGNRPVDGHLAFVYEKCAPVFGYYGYFITEKTLKERAEKFYERT